MFGEALIELLHEGFADAGYVLIGGIASGIDKFSNSLSQSGSVCAGTQLTIDDTEFVVVVR